MRSPPFRAGAQQRFTTQVLLVPAFARTGARRSPAAASDIVRSRVAGAFPRSELRVVSGGDLRRLARQLRLRRECRPQRRRAEGSRARKFRVDERDHRNCLARPAAGCASRLDAVDGPRSPAQPAVTSEGATVGEAAEARRARPRSPRAARFPACGSARTFTARESGRGDQCGSARRSPPYGNAVPARLCMLGALLKLERPPFDSVAAVAQAVCRCPGEPRRARGSRAGARRDWAKARDAAPVWIRLQKTDTTSEALDRSRRERARSRRERQASRCRSSTGARTSIRTTCRSSSCAGSCTSRQRIGRARRSPASAAGARSRVARRSRTSTRGSRRPIDPIVSRRARSALPRPVRRAFPEIGAALRAVSPIAARGIRRGPPTRPRGVPRQCGAARRRGADVRAVAGNVAVALAETKRALAANPKLPHGFLQLAQLEIDAGQPDSALAAIDDAVHHGEDSTTVAQFALARGNALYKAATASQKRDDYQRAMRFLSLAVRIRADAGGEVPARRVGALGESIRGERGAGQQELRSVQARRLVAHRSGGQSDQRRIRRAGRGEAVPRLRGETCGRT